MNRILCSMLLAIATAGLAPAQPSSLETLAEKAIERFSEITAQDLATAKHKLAIRSAALAKTMGSLPDGGATRRDYLKWDAIDAITASEKPIDRQGLAALRTSVQRLDSGAEGLELPAYSDARLAVQRLLDLATLARSRDQQQTYKGQVQSLLKLVERDPQARDPWFGYRLTRQLDFLAGIGQAPALVAAVRASAKLPNLQLTVSESLLDRIVRRPVNSTGPIRDTILGARVVGTSDTQAMLSVNTRPMLGAALLDFTLSGSIHSETTGYKGPVAVRSAANTSIMARKEVRLTHEEFLLMPASASAKSRSRTRSIRKRGGGLGSGLVEKLAERQVKEDRPKVNYITSRRAEGRVMASFDNQVNEAMQRARQQYDNWLTKPLARYGALPAWLALSTTDATLEASLLQADRGEFGAPGSAPPPPSTDIVVRAHVSASENLATALLGGVTLTKQSAAKRATFSNPLPDWLDEVLPEETKPASNPAKFRPWSITLRTVRPVSVAIDRGELTLTLHAAQIESGGENYRGWDLIIRYAPEIVDGQWHLVMRGKIDAIRTGFDPKTGKDLAAGRRPRRQRLAVRTGLIKVLNDNSRAGFGIPNSIELPPIELSRLDRSGLNWLVIRSIDLSGGWLTISWDAI